MRRLVALAATMALLCAAALANSDCDANRWEHLSMHPVRLGVPSLIIENVSVSVPAAVMGWLCLHMAITSLLPPTLGVVRLSWANHLTSIAHCVVSLSLAVPATLSLSEFPTSLGAPNSEIARLTLVVVLGYFVMDLGMSTVYSVSDAAVKLHHVVCVAGMSYVLWTGHSGAEIVTAIAIGEITIPPYNFRWMLRCAGLRAKLSRIFIANEVVFFVVFVVFRVVIGVPFTVSVVLSEKVAPFIKICACVLLACSGLWFAHLVSRVMRSASSWVRTGEWALL
eukprot:Amastigsp_a848775_45.p1 type:complete len:281 gc:universal Amastigsp_a848775_45:892-50(-)